LNLSAALLRRRLGVLPAQEFRCGHDDLKLVINLMEQFLGKFGFAAMQHGKIVAQYLS
jgi:hypothetical protein